MSTLTTTRNMLPLAAQHRSTARRAAPQDAAPIEAAPALSHVATIKRFCKVALGAVLFTGVVTGIVVLRAAIALSH
jgi:hypothetical protein